MIDLRGHAVFDKQDGVWRAIAGAYASQDVKLAVAVLNQELADSRRLHREHEEDRLRREVARKQKQERKAARESARSRLVKKVWTPLDVFLETEDNYASGAIYA